MKIWDGDTKVNDIGLCWKCMHYDLRLRHGKITFRPIISQDEAVIMYGKEQELGKFKDIKEIAETVNNKDENKNS